MQFKKSDIELRKNKYNTLNEKLSYLSNNSIKMMIRPDKNDENIKWGLTKIFDFNKQKIFIKAIPIAKLFAKDENHLNSANLYKLPAFYHYGIGSAGINPWRELLLHIKTTNYVLTDKFHNFPILYHYRVVEDDNNDNIKSGLTEKLLNRWDNNKNIIKYLKDRSKSKYKIVLFLEYIPYVGRQYLLEKPDFIKPFHEATKKIVTFMNKNGILHCDSHLANYIIDDKENVYITDFGLSLDKEFDLDKGEKRFMKMNKKLDVFYTIDIIMANYFQRCVRNQIIEARYELKKCNTTQLIQILIDNIDVIKSDLKMNRFQYNFIKKNKNKIMKYSDMIKNFENSKNKKNHFINPV